MVKLLGILLFILWHNVLLSQVSFPVLQWQKPLGGRLEDFGGDILLTTDGGFIVLGGMRSNDGDGNLPPHRSGINVFIAKYDANREFVWAKEYGGDRTDHGISIKQVTGGYIVLAATNSQNWEITDYHNPFSPDPPMDIWLFKIDNDGVLLWNKCLGGFGDDLPGSIDITPSGGYIISGYTNSNDGDVSGNHGGNGDIWVVELNATGSIIWQRCYGGSGYDGGGITRTIVPGGPGDPANLLFAATQLKVLPGGEYILTGAVESNNGDITVNHGGSDTWLARLNTSGNIVWQTCQGGNGMEMPCGVIPLNDGYVVGGISNSEETPFNNKGAMDGWMFKTDLNGNMKWQYNYGGNADDICFDIIQAADGGFYMVGGMKSQICHNHGMEDFWTIKTDSEGKWIWEQLQGGSKNDYATSIAEGSNGALYLAGWEQSNDRDVIGHHNNPNNPASIANDAWMIIYDFAGATDITPKVSITSSVDIICEGKPVEFKAAALNGGNSLTYFWYVNGVEQPDYDDTFVTTTLQDGDKVVCKLFVQIPCMAEQLIISNEITIHWYPNGRASGFLPLEITKCVNLYETIEPTRPFTKYLWSTGATTPSIRVVNPGLYWLEVTDLTGCSGRENVWVKTKSCMNAVFVPSAFTPNNDGLNDIFKPLVDGHLTQYKFSIYNRNGQIVFQTSDPTKGWNGTDRGYSYNTGVFVWICTYQLAGEQVKTEKGTVTLIR